MEKIWDFKDSATYRFQCDCRVPSHAIDVEVYKDGVRDVIFYFDDFSRTIGERLKWCWRMIRKGEGYNHDFVISYEDVPALIQILQESMKEQKEG